MRHCLHGAEIVFELCCDKRESEIADFVLCAFKV